MTRDGILVVGQQLYVIEYELHNEPRTFIIRLEKIDKGVAWHWASCDAGVGIIPRFSQQNIKLVSRPMAERYGVAKVKWRLRGRAPHSFRNLSMSANSQV